jgi:hypothetical protein
MKRMMRLILLLVLMSLPLLGAPGVRAQSGVNTQIDVVLVIDNSGSMQDNDPRNLRFSAARLFINLLTPGDKVGVVSMADRETTRAKLSLTPVDGFTALDEAAFRTQDELSNWTYMGESLDLAGEALDSAAQYNPQRAVILLTDGLPTYRDEDRATQEQKFAAAVEQFKADGVKVFPIALGDAADAQFLSDALATPTNGRTWSAGRADQLLQVYIEILALLQDGRYVDRYEVLGNVETFLANVNPRQQIRQINFVFPAIDTPPPEIVDLKLPNSYRNSVGQLSNVIDPAWTMSTARPEYISGFNGEWRTVLQSATAQVPLAAVLKSDLRARLIEPISQLADDDVAARYYPAGRPLLLRAGALNPSDRFEKRLGLRAREPQPGSCASVTQQANEWDGQPLEDEGSLQDLAPVDGEYAGLFAAPLDPGTYCVLVNISSTDSHLRLDKPYELIVEPLPTMQVQLLPEGRLTVGQPIEIVARWALGDEPVEVDDAEIRAAVKRDDRVITTMALEPQGDGSWRGEYLPPDSGAYSFGLTAHATWNAPDRGLRRYTDYAEATYNARTQPLVEVRLAGSEADEQRVNTLHNGIQRTLHIRSHSDQPVELALDVAGLPDGDVFPATLLIQPGEEVQRTVTISSQAGLESGRYEAEIEVSSPPDVRLSTQSLPLAFTVNGWLARFRCLIMLALLGGLLLVIPRIRNGLIDGVSRNLELLRYGGR